MSQTIAELRFQREARQLRLVFEDMTTADIPFELLRLDSPSAEVQGHGGQRPTIPTGKETIGILEATPVGHYAVRITFDDGHDSGLFTWTYLKELSEEPEARLARLKA
tara:strand:+ start:88 stop:411 length:324 start_codon:yes stop_codon:yes gene_type:complete